MKYLRWLFCLCLMGCFLISGVSALEFRQGGLVSVKDPINDDVFASGGRISIDAPVRSIVAAGGIVDINAPVAGDVIAAGGQVTINSDVGGKVVAAGGKVTLNGKTQNLVAAGGLVTVGRGAVVQKDAALSGQQIVNEGDVVGTLYAQADGLINAGTVGKVVMPEKTEQQKGLPILLILVTIGFLILGCLIIRFIPGKSQAIAKQIRQAPLMNFLYGFLGTLVLIVVTVIIGITIIGLPIAVFLAMALISVILLAPLFASLALGEWIADLAKKTFCPYLLFIIGFVILNLLFAIPFLVGIIIRIVVTAIGIGAMFVVFRDCWKKQEGCVCQAPVS